MSSHPSPTRHLLQQLQRKNWKPGVGQSSKLSKSYVLDFFSRVGTRMGGRDPKDVERFYFAFLEELMDTVRKKQFLRLPSFGSFVLTLQKGRIFRVHERRKKDGSNEGKTHSGFFPDHFVLRFEPMKKVRNYLRAMTRQFQKEQAIERGEDPEEWEKQRSIARPIETLDFEDSEAYYPLKKRSEDF